VRNEFTPHNIQHLKGQEHRMRTFLLLMCILAVSCSLLAQDKAASWANLNTLRAGERIRVRTMTSSKVTGTFLNVSEAAISVQAEAGPQTIQRQDVRTVKRMKTKHRWVNSLILAGAGAGIGYGIGRSQYHPCTSSQTFCFDIAGDLPGDVGLVAGFLGGGVIGALIPVHETVYSVTSH
jgi:hypothetical protein